MMEDMTVPSTKPAPKDLESNKSTIPEHRNTEFNRRYIKNHKFMKNKNTQKNTSQTKRTLNWTENSRYKNDRAKKLSPARESLTQIERDGAEQEWRGRVSVFFSLHFLSLAFSCVRALLAEYLYNKRGLGI